MNIDSIQNGYVIDHIKAGSGLKIYSLLKLDELDASVAVIQKVASRKMGRKDIIKIDADIDVDLDIIGFIDPNATINVIKDGERVEKKKIEMPRELVNVIKCKNPRCITQTEQELDQVFCLSDKDGKVYRCLYCESKAK